MCKRIQSFVSGVEKSLLKNQMQKHPLFVKNVLNLNQIERWNKMTKKIKTFTIEFFDTVEAESEQEVYAYLLEYLESCVKNEDVEGFQIEEV